MEPDEDGWEYAVAALREGGFVVSWKAFAGKNHRTSGIRIRARIFNSQGESSTGSINVSSSPGEHARARVYGLPDGGFVALWSLFNKGALLRVFDSKGIPATPETLVVNEEDLLVPYGYVAKSGSINVFLRPFYDHGHKTPFRYARSYDRSGRPLTDVLKNEEIFAVDGYQIATELVVREKARNLEHGLRGFLERDFMGFRFCSPENSASIVEARRLQLLSIDSSMRSFAKRYCEEYKTNCTPSEYIKRELDSCRNET
jgi:hypothetical protein